MGPITIGGESFQVDFDTGVSRLAIFLNSNPSLDLMSLFPLASTELRPLGSLFHLHYGRLRRSLQVQGLFHWSQGESKILLLLSSSGDAFS